MRFRSFLKGYGGYHLYKRSTGYYDHYNPKDEPNDEDGKGCILTIIIIALALIGTYWGGAAAKAFLGIIGLIWLYLKYCKHQNNKAVDEMIRRKTRQGDLEAQQDIAYTNRVQHYEDIGRFDLANKEIEHHMQEKYGMKK